MARLSPLVLLPPAVFAALGVVFYLGLGRDTQLPSNLIGQPAPGIQVQPLGALPPLTHETLRDGQPKLVNFFASWCAPCRVEHPNLAALQAAGVPIYGINYKDDPAKAEAFLAELGNPYAAIGTDPKAKTGLDWGVYGVPETFVIDGAGRITYRFAGPLTARTIDSQLKPAMEAAGLRPGPVPAAAAALPAGGAGGASASRG
ncbi:DsbE family thiol:disulfide interchange protein [Paracoccus suum]|uniref:DsbE family thiol:disulfide interchange protein n=1 Tax=Paracoccus suum TaxID=2259340 RepID=A0A344PJL0_9RHOB|nr:DsbE family thiol:disulfide interchange protein [Paracoccus suum]AXC49565.1 DsbE family thiol:disulfide interchange protein [Paracoccus suum]